MSKKSIKIAIGLGLIVGIVGCATPSPHRTDAEMELAMRQAEDATLQRLSHSNCEDIAQAASTLARNPPSRDR